MTENLPLVAVLGIITGLLVRSRDVRTWQAVVIGLFGFYLAMTPFRWFISEPVTRLFGG